MHGPATVGWLLTALCALTGASCLLRARGAPVPQRRVAGSEALMGFGMAAMALPASVVGAAPPALFAVFFGALTVWEVALLQAARTRNAREYGRPGPGTSGHGASGHGASGHGAAHHVHHVVGSLAMVYMALAMATAPGGGHAAHHSGGAHGTGAAGTAGTATGVPLLTGLLLVYFAVYVLHTGIRLIPARTAQGTPAPGPPPGCAVRDLPGFAPACRLAMGTGMFAMMLPW